MAPRAVHRLPGDGVANFSEALAEMVRSRLRVAEEEDPAATARAPRLVLGPNGVPTRGAPVARACWPN